MTSQTGKTTMSGWRRTALSGMASATLAAGLVFGVGSAPARADVLDDLAQEFSLGAGAGQVANLLKTSLKLRSMGIRPSKANYEEIQTALNYRPNQTRLIAALQDTVAYQAKTQAQMAAMQQQQGSSSSVVMGANQAPSSNGGIGIGGGPEINVPIAP
jgi:hypothetical protein